MTRIVSRTISSLIYGLRKVLCLKDPGVRILCYHRVNYHEIKYTTVAVSDFRDQMEFLSRNGYYTIGLHELLNVPRIRSRGPGGSKQEAADSRPGIKGGDFNAMAGSSEMTSFPEPGKAGPDTGERHQTFMDLSSGNIAPGPGFEPAFSRLKPIIITFDDGFRDIFMYAAPILREFGFTATVFCIAEHIGKPGYLSEADLRELVQAGYEIGSHTLSHPELTDLDEKSKRIEIFESKKKLEVMLGMPVPFFCYPRGLYDDETLKLVEDAGYLGACSNRPGSNKLRVESPELKINESPDFQPGTFNPGQFLLRRTEIGGTDKIDDFKKKLTGAYDGLHWALHALRGRP